MAVGEAVAVAADADVAEGAAVGSGDGVTDGADGGLEVPQAVRTRATSAPMSQRRAITAPG